MTIHEFSDLDLSYSPPIGTANDAINMAAFVAENRLSGYGPSKTASEIDSFVENEPSVFIDVRDYFAYEKSHIEGAIHIPYIHINSRISEIPRDKNIFIYSDKGKNGHQVVRELILEGYTKVFNIAGGFPSLERFSRAVGFTNINLPLLPIVEKTLDDEKEVEEEGDNSTDEETFDGNSQLIIDVRTPGEYNGGFYPGAINIPLDLLESKASELGSPDRELILYCASGARSAYGVQILQSMGFTNVTNGGGVMNMMAGLR